MNLRSKALSTLADFISAVCVLFPFLVIILASYDFKLLLTIIPFNILVALLLADGILFCFGVFWLKRKYHKALSDFTHKHPFLLTTQFKIGLMFLTPLILYLSAKCIYSLVHLGG